MMVLPLLIGISLNRELAFTILCGLMLGAWWAVLFWGIWSGLAALWGLTS